MIRFLQSGSEQTKEASARTLRQICVEESARGLMVRLCTCTCMYLRLYSNVYVCMYVCVRFSRAGSRLALRRPLTKTATRYDTYMHTYLSYMPSNYSLYVCTVCMYVRQKACRLECAHAVAKTLVTTNPNVLSEHLKLGAIKPLLLLCK